MDDSVTMLAERRGDSTDSAPVENKRLYYYWSAAFEDLGIPVMPLPMPAIWRTRQDRPSDRSSRRLPDAEIEARLNAAKDSCFVLLLRAGSGWL